MVNSITVLVEFLLSDIHAAFPVSLPPQPPMRSPHLGTVGSYRPAMEAEGERDRCLPGTPLPVRVGAGGPSPAQEGCAGAGGLQHVAVGDREGWELCIPKPVVLSLSKTFLYLFPPPVKAKVMEESKIFQQLG